MSKKMKVYLVVIIVVVLLIAGGSFYFYKSWLPTKQLKIQLGLASDKFPWRDFTQAELNKMYPQIKYADIPTRVTPEQTYAKFREALKTNNLELALEQLSKDSKNYNENKVDLESAFDAKQFNSTYKRYPEGILKENLSETLAQYYFNYEENNQSRTHFLNFIKDANGDWKMDSL